MADIAHDGAKDQAPSDHIRTHARERAHTLNATEIDAGQPGAIAQGLDKGPAGSPGLEEGPPPLAGVG